MIQKVDKTQKIIQSRFGRKAIWIENRLGVKLTPSRDGNNSCFPTVILSFDVNKIFLLKYFSGKLVSQIQWPLLLFRILVRIPYFGVCVERQHLDYFFFLRFVLQILVVADVKHQVTLFLLSAKSLCLRSCYVSTRCSKNWYLHASLFRSHF